jgi:hypothetical protein
MNQLFTKQQLQGILTVINELSGGSREEIIEECQERNIIASAGFVEYMLDVHLLPMGYIKSFQLDETRYNISQVGEIHLISL